MTPPGSCERRVLGARSFSRSQVCRRRESRGLAGDGHEAANALPALGGDSTLTTVLFMCFLGGAEHLEGIISKKCVDPPPMHEEAKNMVKAT